MTETMSKLFGFDEARKYFLALLHKRYPFVRLAKNLVRVDITIRAMTDKIHKYDGSIFYREEQLCTLEATQHQIADYIYLNQLPEKGGLDE